jgi:hypothetical protein
MGSDTGLGLVFKAMARRFNPESALGWTGDIQYLLETEGGTREWYLRVDTDKATAIRGRSTDPELTLRMPFSLFVAIGRGEVSFSRLFLEDSQLRAEGNLALIGRMTEMFVPPGTY